MTVIKVSFFFGKIIHLIHFLLQTRAEKEIRDLGAVKEKLEAEWELVKFMGQVRLLKFI